MAKIGNLNVKILKDSSDHKGMPLEVEVEYLGVKSTISGDGIKSALELFLLDDENKMTPEQLIETVRSLDELAYKYGLREDEVGYFRSDDDKKENKENKENNDDKKAKPAKIRIKKIFKKLFKYALIAGIGFAIVYFFQDIQDWINGIRGRGVTDDDIARGNTPAVEESAEQRGLPDPTAEPTPEIIYATPTPIIVTPEPAPTVAPTPVPTPVPTAVPTAAPTAEPIKQATNDLEIINRVGSADWINMSDEEYYQALTDQTIECQRNMNDIMLFLEGEELNGDKHLTNIQKTFYPGSNDYCITEYFNQYRNEVVNAAYDTRNKDNVLAILGSHLKDMYLFCTNQQNITLNTPNGVVQYYYSDLSNEGRNAALDVLIALDVALPHNYSININGVEMYADNISEFYTNQLGALILVNPTIRQH